MAIPKKDDPKRHWREDREKRMLANPWANPARASGG